MKLLWDGFTFFLFVVINKLQNKIKPKKVIKMLPQYYHNNHHKYYNST